MKKPLFLFLLFYFLPVFSQKLEIQTLLKDKISIRALQISEGKVYYIGTDSKFGFVSLKDSVDKKQIKLSDKKLQFRTLAQSEDAFYTASIESPAYFFRIDKKNLSSEIVKIDSAKNAFYDAIKYNKWNQKFYAFSDPEDDRQFKMLHFDEKNDQFHCNSTAADDFLLNAGEAAFAASNTNIAVYKNYVWVATGGKSSRIFKFYDDNPIHAKIIETPFIQGTSSQGIYSIDFYDDKFGIAVGGDYTKQSENTNNIATTNDGGETWQIQASGKNAGYKTCVKIRPKSKGKDIIAVGDQNIEFSSDFGKTWTTISHEKNLYVCEWIDKNMLVFAGKDRIIKATFIKK